MEARPGRLQAVNALHRVGRWREGLILQAGDGKAVFRSGLRHGKVIMVNQ